MLRSRKLIREGTTIMAELTGMVGFAFSVAENALPRRRAVELTAALTLAVSLIVAVTAVSIDVAHAKSRAAVLTTLRN